MVKQIYEFGKRKTIRFSFILLRLKEVIQNYEPLIKKCLCILMDCEISN